GGGAWGCTAVHGAPLGPPTPRPDFLPPSPTRWSGRCWHIHELLKYEFAIEFEIPVTYPNTAPEIAIPELDGKTAKMYSDHFKPLWARNVPKFGLAHLMA
uniref:Ubiquitin-fold modifier-conjugating enzyme 1 n=1 Tax=Meleagris gallopavo TaxID=9103 RepID=A0A803YGD8_MELGA